MLLWAACLMGKGQRICLSKHSTQAGFRDPGWSAIRGQWWHLSPGCGSLMVPGGNWVAGCLDGRNRGIDQDIGLGIAVCILRAVFQGVTGGEDFAESSHGGRGGRLVRARAVAEDFR